MGVDTIRLLAATAAILALAAGILVVLLHVPRTDVDPWSDGVSAYALTPYAIVCRIEVVATGVAALLLTMSLIAADLSSGIAVVLLAAFGASRILIARYPTDPRGTTSFSRTGRLHILLATITFVTIAVAAPAISGTLTTSAGWSGLADLSAILGWATAASVVGTFASNALLVTRRMFGLVERAAFASMLAWLVVAAAGINGIA